MPSDETRGSRFVNRLSIGLGIGAALVFLCVIGAVVTIHVVTKKYDALHEAVYQKDVFAVRCFLWKGADVNAKVDYGWTLLHVAAARGHAEMVELLIARGADVNAKNNDGMTPLHYLRGQAEMAELLLSRGADINARSVFGETPLHRVALCEHVDAAL